MLLRFNCYPKGTLIVLRVQNVKRLPISNPVFDRVDSTLPAELQKFVNLAQVLGGFTGRTEKRRLRIQSRIGEFATHYSLTILRDIIRRPRRTPNPQ